jgi:thioredoxin-like negative regulator of GroEL
VSAFEQRYTGKLKFIRINIDDAATQPYLKKYNVRGTPTIVLLNRNGGVAANVPGWAGDQAVADALDKLAASGVPRNVVLMQAALNGALAKPAFVEFYTMDCLLCRQIQGALMDLDQRYAAKAAFIYLNIDLDESQPFQSAFNVRGAPTIVLLDRRGKIALNQPGWQSEPAIADALERLVAAP